MQAGEEALRHKRYHLLNYRQTPYRTETTRKLNDPTVIHSWLDQQTTIQAR
jgi:hypothetical protein